MKTFEINGTEYTVEPCTAICAADAGDESKRQEALCVTNECNIAEYMDNDTREAVHNELAPCSDIEFLTRYLELAPDDLIIG